MANAKISQLPSATTPLSGPELLEIVQGGINKQVTFSALVLDELRKTRTVTTADAIVQTDDNSLIIFNSASPINFTLDQLTANTKASFLNIGAGAVTFVNGSGVTLTGGPTLAAAAGTDYPTAFVVYLTNTTPRVVVGGSGGGGAVDSVNGQTGVVVLDAGDIANTPSGGISATTVQAAIDELDTEKQASDADLTAIAGLSPSNDDIIQRKSGAWTNRTMAQLASDLGISNSIIAVSGSGGGTRTLDMQSGAIRNHNVTDTQANDFTFAFSNDTNMLRDTVTFKITGTRAITLPSSVVMGRQEEISGRWNTSTNVLTLVGTTDSLFMIEFHKVGSDVLAFVSERMV